jgi:hypothetical protein
MTSKTVAISRKKQDERERLVAEMERELGKKEDHPEDAEITDTRRALFERQIWLTVPEPWLILADTARLGLREISRRESLAGPPSGS